MRNVSRRILAALLTALVCVTVVTPAHARFVSVDPVKPDTHTGEDFNRYAYARGNPYGYVDPDGRLPIAIPIVIGVGWLLTSGDANAPRPGEQTHSMSAGEAAGRFADALPAHRVLSTGRAVTWGVAPIFGNPQVTKSGGKERSHAPTSQRYATRESESPAVTSVHANQTLRTITKGEVDSPLRPDVAAVRNDGKIDITEVLSPRQDAATITRKYQDALGERAGTITCVQPDKC